MTMFWPSTHASSRNPCRNAATTCEVAVDQVLERKPSRYTFSACCAAASGGASARLTARTTASPIRRMRTSEKITYKESSRCKYEAVDPVLGQSAEMLDCC